MAVFEPPVGVPFVDSRAYVLRPWIDWLILVRTNFESVEENIDNIEIVIEQIDVNTAAIAVNTTNIATNTTNISGLQASVLSNEALAYYFASL